MIVKTKDMSGKLMNWNLKYANRTVAAGRRKVTDKEESSFAFVFPEIKPGVVASSILEVNIHGKARRETLNFYPEKAFELDKASLKKLAIHLWCPESGGEIEKLFGKHDIPFTGIDDPANFDGSVLIVSGLDFDNFPGIAGTLTGIAKEGGRIILLPPFSGKILLDIEEFRSFRIGRNEVVNEFSKKYDSENWAGTKIEKHGFKMISVDRKMSLQTTKSGMSYCEFRTKTGYIILTTWDIAGTAGKSPTPLYLLKNLIMGNEENIH